MRQGAEMAGRIYGHLSSWRWYLLFWNRVDEGDPRLGGFSRLGLMHYTVLSTVVRCRYLAAGQL